MKNHDPVTAHAALLFSRFSDAPALFSPDQAENVERLLHGVSAHREVEQLLSPQASGDPEFWPEADSWKAAYRPYVVRGGVLQIPVKGVLLHNFPWAMGGWATGYTYIQRAFERGLEDDTVRGIALVVDSPGGEVAGCFDLVDKMFARRGTKPVWAFVSEHSYSAAYAVSSVADRIVMSRTGGVGSIGVVTTHIDYSKLMEKNGVKVTYIFAGKHKVDGNQYEPLPDDVKNRIQVRINETYDIFTSTVARNRDMGELLVRQTEALTFSARQALSNGLADDVGTLDDSIAEFSASIAHNPDNGDQDMSTPKSAPAEQAVADQQPTTEVNAGAAATASASAAAKDRIKAILALDEAKTRKDAATNIALETELSVEQAKSLLATLPETKEAAKDDKADDKAAAGAFDEAMAKGDKAVGAGGDEPKEQTGAAKAEATADRLLRVGGFVRG